MPHTKCRGSLPLEVWALIWSDLSLGDIFAVSHVCSLWRSLAVGYPNLWTNVSLTWTKNSASPACRCARCCPLDSDASLPQSTSLEYFAMLLERSRTAPLCLHLDIFSEIKSDLHPAIRAAFTQSSPRLSYLHFRGGGNILADLLSTPQSFPVLRELLFAPHGGDSEYLLTLPGRLEMPVLEMLHGRGVQWPLPDGVTLPSVRVLSIWTRHLPSILSVVKSCPRLERLDLDIILFSESQSLKIPTESPTRFPPLRIWRPQNLQSEFLLALQSAYFPDVILDCGDYIFADWWVIQLFHTAWDTTHLRLKHYKREAPLYHQRCIISAHNSAGLRRAIDVAYVDIWHLPSIGVYLAQFSITSATVDLSLWHYFMRVDGSYRALTELTIIVFSEPEITLAVEQCAKHPDVLGFPSLRILHIRLGDTELCLSTSSVFAFIVALQLPRKLHTLSAPILDSSCFDGLAEHVASSLEPFLNI